MGIVYPGVMGKQRAWVIFWDSAAVRTSIQPRERQEEEEEGAEPFIRSLLSCTRTLCLALLAVISVLQDLYFAWGGGRCFFIPSGSIVF